MFLRSLTIRGFKSFADKTTLEFTPGISVIVGPNGSGKSNIADAIAWVLGEQGPSALRGGQMADVIFAGSPSRPALGMAEVKLVIDNSAGLIPVPASEIEISRSVFRSGDSEYRLGGRPCRLLDIQELLSDTGIGRAMHTIISQGHLEDVLSAKPEERRQFIEEAAGIAKHRRRRERAERKLGGLEQDLLRLQDLVGEVRRQLKPLKQQAELAERHESLTREADEIARKLAAARLKQLYRDRDRRRPSWLEAKARQEEARARLQRLDAEISELEERRTQADELARAAEDGRAKASQDKSDAEAMLRKALGMESEARERMAAAVNRTGRLFALEEELERTERALDEVGSSLERRERELEEAERRFVTGERARREAEDERRRVSEEAAVRRAEANSLRATLATQEAEAERLLGVRDHLDARLAAGDALASDLKAQIERLDAVETPLAEQQTALERARAELSAALAGLEAQLKGLEARREVIEARRAELSETPGMAFARKRAGRVLGVLGELVDAPRELRAAVHGALGPFADAVVYEADDPAIEDAHAERGLGVLLAVASPPDALDDAIRGGEPIAAERPLLAEVRPDPRVAGLIGRLLAGFYVVRSLAEAAAKHRVHPKTHFVTPEGIVVGPAFVRTPRLHDARYEEILKESGALERETAAVRRGIRETKQQIDELAGRSRHVGRELERTDRAITTAAEEMAAVDAELAAARREGQVVAERLSAVEAMAATVRRQLAATPQVVTEPPALPPPAEAPIRLRVDVESLRRERSRLDTGVQRIRREVADLASQDPVVIREEVGRRVGECEVAEETLTTAEAGLEVASGAHREAVEAVRAIEERYSLANRRWRELAAEVDRQRQDHDEEDRARLDLERRIEEGERVLREGHGVDAEETVSALTDGDTVEELQRRAEGVARRMGLLGRVNLLAVGELESVQQRHEFLARELDDVRAARRDLMEVIADVDRRMAELFVSAFEDVNREFTALFVSLFPGGEGRLILVDPSDPLSSGVEVEARPGRKRVKRLSLLSGGERSLAALAFLFAIFRARPSPFYLMDEVEAALDDVNLHRFLEVVRGFAGSSQILVVTHQKRTMEMADVLYGVSMGQGGASRVISQRLVGVAAG